MARRLTPAGHAISVRPSHPLFANPTKPRRQSMSRNRYVRKTQDMESLFAMGLSVIGIVVSVLMVALFVREALRGVLP